MSSTDIRAAHQNARIASPNGEKIRDLNAAHAILGSAGETIRGGEVDTLKEIFAAEGKNPANDAEVREWVTEQLRTMEAIESIAPQINRTVSQQRPGFERLLAEMMKEGTPTESIIARTAKAYGLAVPPELEHVSEATKKLLNAAIKNGATFTDARALEKGEFNVDHGSVMPKGLSERYPQWHALEDIYQASAALERRPSLQPQQIVRADGLDPRYTILNGARAAKLVSEPQTFNVETPNGNGFDLERTTMTWGEFSQLDHNPDAIVAEYDEKSHPDHHAWTPGDGPFANNAMIWLDGTLHFLTAPRRTLTDDKINLGGGILTTGSLGRGYPGWFWGHVEGSVVDLPKDPNDPQSPSVPTFVIDRVGVSGYMCGEIAEGRLTIPDPVDLIKSGGLRTRDGLQVQFENAEKGRSIWKNPTTGLIEKKP